MSISDDNEIAEEGADTVPPVKAILAVSVLDAADQTLLGFAATLAERHGARLHVMAAIEAPSDLDALARAAGLSRAEALKRLADEAQAALEAKTAQLSRKPDTIHVRQGKPFLEIIRHAIDCGADLVLKQVEKRTALNRLLFTSTDQHLLRKCPCPVWLRHETSADQTQRLIAAVDLDGRAGGDAATLSGLNRRIVDAAVQIADRSGAEIYLLNAWDAPGEGKVQLWSDAPDPNAAALSYVNQVQAARRNALNALAGQARQVLDASGANAVRLIPALRRGAPREVIPAETAALQADVLVMGTIARIGVPGFIIGNTAEDILNSIECSVVTVKPPAYSSPVLR